MKNPLISKSFYFIRHGESVWNTLEKFAGGKVDTELTNLGREQAENARKTFNALSPRPTHIIHSTLSRATDTAKILNADRHLPMTSRHDLREIDGGAWEGIHNKQAIENWNKGMAPDNGESMNDFALRIQTAFNDILGNNDYEIPFIAAHGRILNAIDTLYGIAPRSLQANNCQILEFIPSQTGQYPWDVYECDLVQEKVIKKVTYWSQI